MPPAEGEGVQIPVYIRHSPETGTVQAYCPDLPGCSSCGRDEAEAITVLRNRLADQLAESAREAPPSVRVTVIDL